ncbi:MAG: type II toxin-antitoxin system RelE/ParE family toxin [Rhabdochlamydiaceae bacterium]|nr:type II toxin-antitoxin system RelE/ParE family toxin [Rhabdochlamydiaceae bacterium]
MKRLIIQTKLFSNDLDELIAQNKLLITDYEALERSLLTDPEKGDLIKGTGGLRKIRLKSSSKGKSGGFRICYFDFPEKEQLFFVIIYGKNEKENISQSDKEIFKKLIEKIKKN